MPSCCTLLEYGLFWGQMKPMSCPNWSPSGFEIYFYVQLPLGQLQDLVWLPIEYFGCPSSCPSSSQETNTASCLMRLTYFMFFEPIKTKTVL